MAALTVRKPHIWIGRGGRIGEEREGEEEDEEKVEEVLRQWCVLLYRGEQEIRSTISISNLVKFRSLFFPFPSFLLLPSDGPVSLFLLR